MPSGGSVCGYNAADSRSGVMRSECQAPAPIPLVGGANFECMSLIDRFPLGDPDTRIQPLRTVKNAMSPVFPQFRSREPHTSREIKARGSAKPQLESKSAEKITSAMHPQQNMSSTRHCKMRCALERPGSCYAYID